MVSVPPHAVAPEDARVSAVPGGATPEVRGSTLSADERRRLVREAGRQFMAENAELMARLAK